MHRLGYKSVVVEGRESGLDPNSLPFAVISAIPAAAAAPAGAEPKDDRPGDAPALPQDAAARARRKATAILALISQHWNALRGHGHEDGAQTPGTATRSAIGLGLIALRLVLLSISYGALRIFSFGVRNATIVLNKLIYSHFAAFLRHIASSYRAHISPTRKATPPAKLYYLHAPYQFPAIAVRCLLGTSKYVYDAHDFYSHMDDHQRLPSFWTRWVMPWDNMIERWCVRHASAIVTVNQGIAQLMKARFGRDAIILRNAHDPRLEAVPESTLRRSLGLPDDVLLTVCIGQWKRGTAVIQAMQAFATLPGHHHLAFLGANFPSYAAEAAELGLTGRVHFHAAVKANEVVPFVRSADFGLLLYHPTSPSIRNCLPNGFFQPLAAGLPIFYPELPEIVRVADPLDLGLPIDPLDPASIARAVLQLGEDSALRAAKKSRVEAARHALSWERDEEVLKKLIEDLIGLPHAA
ncbi:hypothetical protein [Bosea beijingensis]